MQMMQWCKYAIRTRKIKSGTYIDFCDAYFKTDDDLIELKTLVQIIQDCKT